MKLMCASSLVVDAVECRQAYYRYDFSGMLQVIKPQPAFLFSRKAHKKYKQPIFDQQMCLMDIK
jgi:hypothetical protein